jgi:H+-transporting ATPase
MITGDFLAMSSTTDNVRAFSATERMAHRQPDDSRRRHRPLCAAILAVGKYQLGFDIDRLRPLTLVALLFNGQAVFYVVGERRRLWPSWPSPIVIASSIADLAIIPTTACWLRMV